MESDGVWQSHLDLENHNLSTSVMLTDCETLLIGCVMWGFYQLKNSAAASSHEMLNEAVYGVDRAPSRKLLVVIAIKLGFIKGEQACERATVRDLANTY